MSQARRQTDAPAASEQVRLTGHQPSAPIEGRLPAARGPRIEITPSPAQYEQLCRDLKILRKGGAASNTAAILDAVRAAAAGGTVGGGRRKPSGKRPVSPRSRRR
jgi:hypothetical protein